MRWPLLRVAVAERSMLPALQPGDWLLARRTRRVRPGQIVLAWHPERPGFLLVKRAAWREDGGWWLASDNPAAGAVDSAHFGVVPEEKIVAVVLARYWPPRRRRQPALGNPERLRIPPSRRHRAPAGAWRPLACWQTLRPRSPGREAGPRAR
jgi:nickel-type superoxide dismutase maturation protease